VWAELDDDHSGVVTLAEFDPKAHEAIEALRALLIERYGHMLAAWLEGLDIDGNGRLDEDEWIHRLLDIGFQGDAKYVFHLLKPPERIFMTLDDFDPKAAEALNRGDKKMMTMIHERENPMAMTFDERNQAIFTVKWRRELAEMKLEKIKNIDEAAKSADIGAKTHEGFKKLLVRRFGCMYRAWRQGLDVSGDGKLSFTEFTDAARAIGYAGSVRKLWQHLDDDNSGVITLDEIDPPTFKLINDWFTAVGEKFEGNLISCWKALDTKKKQYVEKEEFVERVVELEMLPKKKAARIFKEFLTDQAIPKLTLEQIDPVAADCLKRGDLKMITAKRGGSPPASGSRPDTGEGDEGAERIAALKGMTFLERQASHGATEWTRDIAERQRVKLKEEEAAKKKADLGAQGLKAFKNLLKTKYGSMLVAWRRALDVSGDGKLSFVEFTSACRAIGYAGSIQKLWEQLDDDNSGVITLAELDPAAHKCIEAFWTLINDRFGDIYNAWCKFFEPAQTGQLELYKFVKKCQELGYKHTHPRNLVKALVPSDRAAYITLRDLDKPSYERLLQEYNQALELAEAKEAANKKLVGARDLDGFKTSLIHRFGNIARAWRDGLDTSGDNKLSFTEFTLACRNIGYMGSVKTLFKELDPGTGVIMLEDLDPETHKAMHGFRELLKNRFGNTLQAWMQGLDLDGNFRLDQPEFIDRCVALGYEGDAAKLFDMLLKEKGSKFLTLEDIDKKAMEAFDHGDFEMLADQPKTPSCQLTFIERQEQHRAQVIRVMVGKDIRQNIEEFWQERKAKDIGGKTLDALLNLLRVRYGSTVAGWTMGIDRAGSGRISWQMFCKGCRSVGFIGNVREVWTILDDNKSGTVSMQELDPPAGFALKEFRDMMSTKFDTIEAGWKALSRGKTNLDIDQFDSVLHKWGYSRDPRKLFNWLKIERANRELLMPDIGIVERIFPREKPQPWLPKKQALAAGISTLAQEDDLVYRRSLIPGAGDQAGHAADARSARTGSRSPSGAGSRARTPAVTADAFDLGDAPGQIDSPSGE